MQMLKQSGQSATPRDVGITIMEHFPTSTAIEKVGISMYGGEYATCTYNYAHETVFREPLAVWLWKIAHRLKRDTRTQTCSYQVI